VARVNTESGEMLTEGEQEQIGHAQYIALCRMHWKEKKTKRPEQAVNKNVRPPQERI